VRVLDYHPNRVARSLRVRMTRTVGLLLSDIQNPFFTSVVRGVEDVLQSAGFTLMLCNSDEKLEREQHYLRTLRAEGAAGLIVAPSHDDAKAYKSLLDAHIPFVAIDRTPSGFRGDTVTVANRDGAQAAVEHLLALGHRRIALVAGPPHLSTAEERRAGYTAALAGYGIDVDPSLVEVADFRQAGGFEAMLRLLDRGRGATGVLVCNNLMTLGALQALHERGLRIPSDTAVVGFDDMPWATALQPPLTAVAQPTYDVGARAAYLLLERFRNPERAAQHVVLPTSLMVRASCGAARTSRYATPNQ
jgi:LacI family transcriptional regulator